MPGHDPDLELTVRSTSGSFSDSWNKNEKGQAVYDEALKRFKLPAGSYILKRLSDGLIVNLAEKLGGQGLVDGDVLVIQAAQPQDG